MALRASVVVPTFRRPESLSRCLAALCAQAFDPAAYEVIVADDAASDEARRVVRCWAERAAARGLALRYVPVTGAHGPAAARNAGWRAAHGPIIAFTDDDCVPTPDWLAAGGGPVFGGGAGGVGPCHRATAAEAHGLRTQYRGDRAGRVCDRQLLLPARRPHRGRRLRRALRRALARGQRSVLHPPGLQRPARARPR